MKRILFLPKHCANAASSFDVLRHLALTIPLPLRQERDTSPGDMGKDSQGCLPHPRPEVTTLVSLFGALPLRQALQGRDAFSKRLLKCSAVTSASSASVHRWVK